jgi:hypothetical protein
MNYGGRILSHISALVELFAAHCRDRSTLDVLSAVTSDRGRWSTAHTLFQGIRTKTLNAEKSGDSAAFAQYQFEEACAKTLYNLSGGAHAPFDSDSPYWIVPTAFALAERLGVSNSEVTRRIAV